MSQTQFDNGTQVQNSLLFDPLTQLPYSGSNPIPFSASTPNDLKNQVNYLQQIMLNTSPITDATYTSNALEPMANPFGEPCRLKSITAFSTLNGLQYILVLDQSIMQAPYNGVTITSGTCKDCFPIGSNAKVQYDYKDTIFINGLIAVCSTTPFPTLTLGSNNCFFKIDYSF